ncbi:uncharacterized protein PHACADRAFT_246535 [Phanerochaete carnosa HHB-10118-sp]|uniref:FAD dependent oxidoreductase domain-containing protein n=1 Tax=Phanerochaete carnosa (strain HHB-10118-sp) TaxID=650164 RepID=K5VC84_PHACS|nr:uncharacterized protein PHACADRAFT_246535 [Phanerochaete carnosa HHB-10118-sp]EKM60536.1 hypothetical protein PHACADRAFT_246535 [Phanerochaete carnosa HHB-10118-sp]
MINQFLDQLSRRIKESPGLPVMNPSLPFWTIPKSPISSIQQPLPDYVDTVVIGSGITGASFVYNALSRDDSIRVLMLEARDVCSGATGRNGGHINPPLWNDWNYLKAQYGEKDARILNSFRLAHVRELQAIASQEDILKESQVRVTEHLEVFFTQDDFTEECEALEEWKGDVPEVAQEYIAYADTEAQEKFSLSIRVAGCISGPGGAIHPYRFVTCLLVKLLDRHSERFFITAHTPCTDIKAPTASIPYYTVCTPRGNVLTAHVVHATNSWVSHLVAPMREKVVPICATMSVQRPGMALGRATLDGQRSYVFHPGGLGYDYLTQLPVGEHELMFGGGWASAFDIALAALGASDDSTFSVAVASHLAGALPLYFGERTWGREKEPEKAEDDGGVQWGEGRTKAEWGGILGISADGLPWVGRLPQKVSGRSEPPASSTPRTAAREAGLCSELTAAPGEWISAGYTGEGMTHAWLSGKALASMVLNREDELREWFPEMLRMTEKRWKQATLGDFLVKRLSSG